MDAAKGKAQAVHGPKKNLNLAVRKKCRSKGAGAFADFVVNGQRIGTSTSSSIQISSKGTNCIRRTHGWLLRMLLHGKRAVICVPQIQHAESSTMPVRKDTVQYSLLPFVISA